MKLEEEAPTNSAGTGANVAGLDNNPPGIIAAQKRKNRKFKSFKVFTGELRR